jgi:hypothetical protein
MFSGIEPGSYIFSDDIEYKFYFNKRRELGLLMILHYLNGAFELLAITGMIGENRVQQNTD